MNELCEASAIAKTEQKKEIHTTGTQEEIYNNNNIKK